jgi:hypothetical protein
MALLWGVLVGCVAGALYLAAWRDPNRNRITRLISGHLVRMSRTWWRPAPRLQMFVIAIVCFGLALFGIIVFLNGQ